MEYAFPALIALVAFSPVILFLLVPILFPPTRYPLIAWFSIAVGFVLTALVVWLQYRGAADFCAQGAAFESDCNGAVGAIYFYGLYFGLFPLAGFFRLVLGQRKLRSISSKGLS